MPIEKISQPEYIPLGPGLRLRRFAGLTPELSARALGWYQDPQTARLVDGPSAKPYTQERLEQMYGYLHQNGELYWIEEDRSQGFCPVGDVCLLPGGDLPIVIGPKDCRGRGIGGRVLRGLIARARELEFPQMRIKEIYRYNEGSRRLFLSCGFREAEPTAEGSSFVLDLEKALGDCRRLYAAYGSNLNRAEMAVRCPGAQPVGVGELRDYGLVFRAGGKGVYLTVEPRPGCGAPVALWALTPEDELALDEYEVYPELYAKEQIQAEFRELATGRVCRERVLVYVMVPGHQEAEPGREYVERCLAGYRDFGLKPGPELAERGLSG